MDPFTGRMRWRLRLFGGGLAWLAGAALLGGFLTPVAAQPLVPEEGVEAQTPGTRADQGQETYRQQCAWCHGAGGDGTNRGPSLIGAGAASVDFYLRSGRMPLAHPDADTERDDPSYDEETIEALVAYVSGDLGDGEGPDIPIGPVEQVRAGETDLSAGGSAYRLNCAACHNWDGKGGALTAGRNAPPLHGIDAVEVAEAIRVGPGTMPDFSADVLDDEALRDVTGYVAYLDDPQDPGGWPLTHWGPSAEMLAAFAAMGLLVVATAGLGGRA